MDTTHHTFLGKLLAAIGSIFHKPTADLVIAETEAIKKALDSGIADDIVKLTKTPADDELLAALRKKLPVIIYAASGIKQLLSLGDNPSDAAVQEAMGMVVDAFGTLSGQDRQKFITDIATQSYIFITKLRTGEEKLSYGTVAALVEGYWQDWQSLQQVEQQDTTPAPTPAP